MDLPDDTQRRFYEIECIRGNWSVRELRRQIASLYYQRSGLSKDKAKLSAMAHAAADTLQPAHIIRDPYRWASTILKTEDDIDTLKRLVVIFLETAELRLKSRQDIRMNFWKENVDQIITSNGFPLLDHAGSISHEQMENQTCALYLDYDQRRKTQEAHAADQKDGKLLRISPEELRQSAEENTLRP